MDPLRMTRQRIARGLAAAAAVWALAAPAASAADAGSEETVKMVVILLTVIVALLIGMVLYQYSQRSSRVRFERDAPEAAAKSDDVQPSEMLMPVVLGELSQVQASQQQRERIARNVSEVVAKTVEERIGHVKKQLTEQYGQIIEEKTRSAATLQHKYQEAVAEKQQTSAVLESIAEGLVVINNKGEVVMMNPAAEKLLAVEQKSRIGRPLTEGLQDDQLISLVQGSNEDRDIVLAANQDSTKRVLRASNAVVTDQDGRAVGMVAVLSDVTKQRELDQLKSEFVSKVSHELRTPLVAMQHALSILHDQVAGPMSDEQQKFITLIQRNLQRLNGLINDLLDLSKLEAKKMQLRLEPASMAEVVQTVCDSLDAWSKSKGINLTKKTATLPSVMCDAGRVTQVLTNLLGNAIKFTPQQGWIVVEAKLVDGGAAVEVSVTDNGVGIAKEDLPKLFNKFQQVGERTAADVSGTGLGLAISKEIIELHGGRIWAESDQASKKGARFAFTLPVGGPAPAGGAGA
jgi:PAS domain S-box-containing protein